MNPPASPAAWIRHQRGLPYTTIHQQIRRWFSGRTQNEDPASARMIRKHRLRRQLEFFRDEIAEARRTGLSWKAIGAMLDLEPETVRSIHAE